MPEKHPTLFILCCAAGLSLILGLAVTGSTHAAGSPNAIIQQAEFRTDMDVKWSSAAAVPGQMHDRIGIPLTEQDQPDADPDGDQPLCYIDFGDLPSSGSPSYGAIYQQAGHIPQGLTLGASVDLEDASQPNTGATGDDANGDDEDGVLRDMTDKWTPGATVDLFVTVNGCTGSCYLNAWVDWTMDGDFSDPGEWIFNENLIANGAGQTRSLTVPVQGYQTGDSVYARFRLCKAGACNSPTVANVSYGEIEDYYWEFKPTAVTLNSLRATSAARPASGLAVVGLLGMLLAGLVSWRVRRSR